MSTYIRLLYMMLLFILPSIVPAQEWVARYNGPGNGGDVANAVVLDSSGNVYVTGGSYGSSTGQDFATVKYDAAGVEQWVARYNGPGFGDDIARSIAVDNLGNVIVTGYSTGEGTLDDYATVKYDTSGIEQWVARYDGPSNAYDRAYAIAVDDSGNVYVTGESRGVGDDYDYATVKYDASGVEQWVARYDPGDYDDCAYAIALDNSGSIYVTGESYILGVNYDYATVKYDASGVEQWVARYNGPSWYPDCAYAIALDNAGNVHVTGRSMGSETGYDYATVKYDPVGIEQWVARYSGSGNYVDCAHAIVLDDSGNVYVTGESSFFPPTPPRSDYATLKYDSSGVEQWVARYDGPANWGDFAYAIALDNAGNVYVTGRSYGSGTSYDYATVKYDASGIEQWVARYDGPANMGDIAYAIALDNSGNVYVTGGSYGSGTASDYATIKYSSTGIRVDTVTRVTSRYLGATIFSGLLPMPKDTQCRVLDITGRVVERDKIQPGIYFIEIDGVVTQKVVKVR